VKLSITPSAHIRAIPINGGYMKVGDSWIRKIADGFELRGI
jgi:hypothetical protein